MASKQQATETVWFFDVSDPRLHSKGFTVYKVLCKIVSIRSPELLKEVVVWKRYNDFKLLHKSMLSLHKALQRRDVFPLFAKPKLFGRFDDEVVEERRVSALSLLNFICKHSHLIKSKQFANFLEDSEPMEPIDDHIKAPPAKLLTPSKLQILNRETSSFESDSEVSADALSIDLEASLVKKIPEVTVDSPHSIRGSPQFHKSDSQCEMLGGVWNHPQVMDDISINSSDPDDEDVTDGNVSDVGSTIKSPLPDTDMSFFDPLMSDGKPSPTHELHQSNSWLFSALTTCAEMSDDASDQPISSEQHHEGGISINFPNSSPEMEPIIADDRQFVNNNNSVTGLSSSHSTPSRTANNSIIDVSEFDPLRSRTGSKVECGKGDLDLSFGGSVDNSVKSPLSSASSSPSHRPGIITSSPSRRQRRANTSDSVSNMDLGGKEDYIYLAANQICLAQECQANGKFEMAFAYYKSGVGILLQGVQGDSNKARRDAVRRKTAQYLMRAEDLYNRHLVQETLDERRWAVDSKLSPSVEMDPSLAFIRASASELRNYKVLGMIDRVILVLDKTSDETYIVKSVYKSSTFNRKIFNILPTSQPYIVHLFKFYETENAIHLLLQYASGGKLYDHISAYLTNHHHHGEQAHYGNNSGESGNAYTGHKLMEEPEVSEPTGTAIPVTVPAKSSKQEGEQNNKVEDCSESYVGLFVNESSNAQVKFSKIDTDINKHSHTKAKNKDSLDIEWDHQQYSKRYSASSDEFLMFDNQDKRENIEHSDKRVDGDLFQRTLIGNNSALENFSIASFDSDCLNDSSNRHDSLLFDHIASIPEGNENPLSDGRQESSYNHEQNAAPTYSRENSRNSASSVFMDTDEVCEARSRSCTVESHTDDIVKSARELLNSVDRALLETDTAVGYTPEAQTSDRKDSLHVVNKNTVLPSSDSESIEESIYDLHSRNIEGAKVTSRTGHDISSQANDRIACNLNQVAGLHDNMFNKPGLQRATSKELARSASLDCDVKSPTRTRTLSSVFAQLDQVSLAMTHVQLPESCIKQWGAEIIVALSRLHICGIICRDLKPSNLLLGNRGHVMLTYFFQLNNVDHPLDPIAVEQLYVAPEVRGIGSHTESCDWWSFGALLFELLIGKSLLSCHPGGITSHTQLMIPAQVSAEAQGLLEVLLCYNPRERLGSGINGVEDIKAHPFFSGIDWNAMETCQ